MRIFIICCIGFSYFVVMNKSTETHKRKILSSFCQLSLSDEMKQSYLSFTDTYSFKIDDNGIPVEIRKAQAKYTNEEEVKACLEEWKLKGFASGATFHVEFSWKHGIGWVQMRISSKNFSQITIDEKVN